MSLFVLKKGSVLLTSVIPTNSVFSRLKSYPPDIPDVKSKYCLSLL